MADSTSPAARDRARSLQAVCLAAFMCGFGLSGLACAADHHAHESTVQNATPPAQPTQQSVPNNAAAPSPARAPKAAPAQPASKPLWSDLTPAQQQALAPLAGEWNKLSPARRSKWLAIGNKYASMNPDEQQRVQARMREWVSLTPEQRRLARDSYARAKKLEPNQKSEQWEKYQQLPEEQKKKLAADATSKKQVATLPPASQPKTKTVPPIKSTPKPVLEQSLTPQATSQSAISPSPQPASK
jgi:hypothetical protein